MNHQRNRETKKARHNGILEILNNQESITIEEIKNIFHVTPETARKDLTELEQKGLLVRFHGGADIVRKNDFHEGPLLQHRMAENTELKEAVAAKAAALAGDGETVMLDSGSTAYLLTQKLLRMKNMILITNSLPAAMLTVEAGIRTLVLGGEVFEADASVGGPWVNGCLSNIMADVAFIGASSINNPVGPAVENFTAGDVKAEMLAHARKKYIITDSSKYAGSSLIAFSRWEEVDGIIIDGGVSQKFISMVEGKTKIIFAD